MSSLSEKMRQLDMLRKVTALEDLIDGASKIAGNPIVMFDTSYNFIASTRNVTTDDPIWNEIVDTGGFSAETQRLFMEEGFIDAVANAGTIALLPSAKLKYDRILGKIHDESGSHVANLIIVACNRKSETEDPLILEVICQIFSEKISSSESFQNYRRFYEEKQINWLIDGDIVNPELYSAHMAILYNGLKENLFLAVAKAAESSTSDLSLLKDHLIQAHPAFKISIYENYIVMIISSDGNTLNTGKDLDRLERFSRKKNLYVGISRRFENLFQLSEHYEEAVNVLKNGLIGSTDRRIFSHGQFA